MTKQLHILIALVSLGIFLGCTEPKTPPVPDEPKQDETKLPFDERVERHVRAKLNSPINEELKIDIYREHLNADGREDAIICVNQLALAQLTARDKGRMAKAVEMDFWGNYNNFFYYDSELDMISPQIPIVSSATRPLKISFVNLNSPDYKAVLVDYHIRNSQFRRIYPIINHTPTYVFQWKIYDGLATSNPEAYCFQFQPSATSEYQDVLIRKGILENVPLGSDYHIDPKIECTEEILHQFFYVPSQKKYFTKKAD